jgi:hypothetical protein
MSNTILLKRSGNAAVVPLAANLSLGELSLNYADGVLYFLNSGNVVTVLANANTAAGTQLVNGTSNVVTRASGNVTISSAGTANVLTISSTGIYTSGLSSVTGNITGGNISTAGLLSASNNLVINAPSPTTEGGQLVLAWANQTVTGQANSTWNIDVDGSNALRAFYQNATGATNVLISASPTSNIVSFPSTTGISATGNVTGAYFIGNGSQLTGITGGGTPSSIVNGTSNVVAAASGNVTVAVANTAAVATFATTGEYVTGLISATGNITGNYIATTGSGGNISGTGNITGGNLITGGIVSVAGNIVATTITTTVGSNGNLILDPDGVGDVVLPTNTELFVLGTQAANSTTTGAVQISGGMGILGNIYSGGLVSVTGNITSGNISATNHTGTTVSVTGAVTGASVVGGVMTGTSLSVTGAVTGASVVGGVMTGTSLSVSGTVTGASHVGSVVSVTGTISGASASLSGNIASISTANITGFGNILINGSSTIYGCTSVTLQNGTNLPSNTANVVIGSTGNITLTPGNIAAYAVVAGNLFVGTSSLPGNITGGNIQAGISGFGNVTGGNVSVSGNVTGGNIISASNIQAGVSSLGNITGGNISVSGAITVGSISNSAIQTNGNVRAWGGGIWGCTTITMQNTAFGSANIANIVIGSGAGNITLTPGNIAAFAVVSGNLSVTGAVTAASTVGGVMTGTSLSVSGTVTGASHVGSVVSVTGAVTGASVVGGVMTGTSLSATANVTGGNVLTGGLVSATGTITGSSLFGSSVSVVGTIYGASTVGGVITGSSASVTGTVTGASLAGTITTASQTNITAVGTLTSLTASNSTVGSWITQINGGSLGNTAGNQVLLSRWNSLDSNANYLELTETRTSAGSSWTTAGTRLQEKIDATWMGFIQFNGTNTNGGITFGTGTSTANAIAVPDRIYLDSSGNFYPAAANAQTLGSSANWWSTVYGKAVQAQYADLAENYTADADYAPGTILVFGGTAEVTVNSVDSDRRVAGVVSTNPAYLMNSSLTGTHVVALALTGRVPTMVIGPVKKGDLMVAAGLGRARAEINPQVGTVIGKALEDFNGAEGTIEIVVGRT